MSDLALTWPGSGSANVVGAQGSEPVARTIHPNEGKLLRAFGDEITVHLGGVETGGRENDPLCSSTSWPLPVEKV